MSNRWFWMSGNSMKFTKWPQNRDPHHYSSPCGGMARGELYLWEDQPCKELLNFICQSDKGYTSHPAYVHVFSFTTIPSLALSVPYVLRREHKECILTAPTKQQVLSKG